VKNNPFENTFIAIITCIAIGSLFWLFSDFLSALFFALLISNATFDYYKNLTKKYSDSISSFLMVFLVIIIFIIPFSYVLITISAKLYPFLNSINFSQEYLLDLWNKTINLAPFLDNNQTEITTYIKNNLPNIINNLKNIVFVIIQSFISFSSDFVLFIFISIFTLFYFYKYGSLFNKKLNAFIPLEKKLTDLLLQRFITVSTVLVGNVFIIAIIQGIVFSLLMLMVDLPALFLGVLVAIASFIPVIGSALIWVPIAIYFMINGDFFNASLVIIFSVIIIGFIIDNILRPILLTIIAKKSKTKIKILNYTLINVLSTFAGILKFGILGLFIGPIIAAMAVTIFELFTIKFNNNA